MFSASMSEILAVEKESRRLGEIEALSRLRVKVVELLENRSRTILDDVLALIDEEMRDGQA